MNQNMGHHPNGSEESQGQPHPENITTLATMVTLPNSSMYTNYGQRDVYPEYPGMYNQKQNYVHQMSKENGGGVYDVPNSMYDLTSPHQLSEPTLSPSPPPPPRVYRPCVVCLDKSSGYHYGVSSCEGCKGFFRRSVQKNMQYTCHKDKNCPINKVTRNRCQYCRLQKCFSTGMSREAVRNDRNKKRKSKPESSSSSSSSTTSTTQEELTEDENMLIQDILEAHRATCDTTPLSPNGVIDDTTEEPENGKEKDGDKNGTKLWDKISLLSSGGIVKIVDFAKKLTGFSSLCTSDQITLLKAACLEIMILRLSFRYDPDLDSMVFSNKVCINREQLEKGGFGGLASTIFNFAASLKSMSTDETEFAVLSAVCLVSGDRSGLKETVKIEQMQEPLLEALKHYVRSRRDDQPHVFAKMLMKLTDLRSISVKGETESLLFAVNFMNDILAPVEKRLEEEPLGIYRYNGIRIIESTSGDSPLPSKRKEMASATYKPNKLDGFNYEPYQMQYGSSNMSLSSNTPMEFGSNMRMSAGQSSAISPMQYLSGQPSTGTTYSDSMYQPAISQNMVSSTTSPNGHQYPSTSYPNPMPDARNLASIEKTANQAGSSNMASSLAKIVSSGSSNYDSIQCEVKIENVTVPASLIGNGYNHQLYQHDHGPENKNNVNSSTDQMQLYHGNLPNQYQNGQQHIHPDSYDNGKGCNSNSNSLLDFSDSSLSISSFGIGNYADDNCSSSVSRLMSQVMESSEPVSQFGGIISEALSDILQL